MQGELDGTVDSQGGGVGKERGQEVGRAQHGGKQDSIDHHLKPTIVTLHRSKYFRCNVNISITRRLEVTAKYAGPPCPYRSNPFFT